MGVAQALATKVRYDSVTRLRMPSFFFQDFNIISHPETGAPWWVPKSLALRQASTVTIDGVEGGIDFTDAEKEGKSFEASAKLEAPTAEAEAVSLGTATGPPPNPVITAGSGTVVGPTAYIIARQSLIKSFQQDRQVQKDKLNRVPIKGMGNNDFHRRLFGPSSSKFKALGGRAVWREDMDEFVLGQMREQIVEDLHYLSRLCETDSRYYIMKCWGWDDIKFKHKGAVLWFNGGDVEPGPFSTYDICTERGKTSVAVHNLPMLLGDDLAEKVRREATVFKDGTIFMLAGRRTTDLQLKLWKLQGYIYDFSGLT